MADGVTIQVQAAVDGAVTNINKVNTALGKTETAAKKSGGVFRDLAGKVDGALKSFTGFGVAQAGAAAALSAVVITVKKAVSEYITYANAMEDGARLTGIQIEEYSRLVQVADDVRLTQEQLKTAFVIASRQGIDVSIEGLQRLSEQYNGLTNPTEKAQLLLETFGRSGADMGRLMELGAAGIAEATGSIAANMVVTEESAAAAEKLRLSQDALSDTWTGLKNQLATAVIPALNDLITGFDTFINQLGRVKGALEDHEEQMRSSTMSWEDYSLELIDAYSRTGKLTKEQQLAYQAMKDGNLTTEAYNATVNKLVDDLGGYSESGLKAYRAQQGLNAMVEEGIPYFGALSASVSGAAGSTYELEQVTATADIAMQKFTKSLLYKIAAEGLDDQAALALAASMGLVNVQTLTAIDKTNEYKKMLDDGTITLEVYNALVAGLGNHLAALESRDLSVTVSVDSSALDRILQQISRGATLPVGLGSGVGGNDNPLPRGGGGAMRRGEWYTVGDLGPEPVRAGMGAYASTTNNFNMTINSNSVNANDVQWGFETMQLLMGQ